MECLSPNTLPNGADDVSQCIYNCPGQGMRYQVYFKYSLLLDRGKYFLIKIVDDILMKQADKYYVYSSIKLLKKQKQRGKMLTTIGVRTYSLMYQMLS